MAGIVGTALAAGLVALGSGLFIGETTVDAMQVRRVAATHEVAVDTALIAAGTRWARAHHPAAADNCPQPSLLFQWGCVMGTSN